MFGIRFVKFQPTSYVMKYKSGRIVKEGTGLSFYYYAPTTSLVSIPISSMDAPFIFEEVTQDFQTVSIQGQITFRIADPKKIAQLMDFTLDVNKLDYTSGDPEKLHLRVVNLVQVLVKREIARFTLKDVLKSIEEIVHLVSEALKSSNELGSLGIEVLVFSILAIKPNAETARALEAETRERILKEADDAIYARRNAAVEQERLIKENELNTEIAVENKRRQIRETQMEAERSVQEKRHQLEDAETAFKIDQEDKRRRLVELASANSKAEADARAYALTSLMKSFHGVDPAVVQALASLGMKPNQLIALAFQGLAEKAERIGQLNVSPDLLRELLDQTPTNTARYTKSDG
ncbi:MAG: SPFH domain-containing protein [Firmicutes bacterium]|nr:SPFH domain-containing protein [Bacillota bacterium]